MPFLSYYYFRFIGRYCYFRLSVDIVDGTVETAVPENKGVAVEISFLSGRRVKLEGADLPLPPLSRYQIRSAVRGLIRIFSTKTLFSRKLARTSVILLQSY